MMTVSVRPGAEPWDLRRATQDPTASAALGLLGSSESLCDLDKVPLRALGSNLSDECPLVSIPEVPVTS